MSEETKNECVCTKDENGICVDSEWTVCDSECVCTENVETEQAAETAESEIQ